MTEIEKLKIHGANLQMAQAANACLDEAEGIISRLSDNVNALKYSIDPGAFMAHWDPCKMTDRINFVRGKLTELEEILKEIQAI